MMAPPVQLARKILSLATRGLGTKVDFDIEQGNLVLSAVVDRLVLVELKVLETMGNREVIHRIVPYTTSLTWDKADDMGKALIKVSGQVKRLIPVIESYLNSDQYAVAV